MQFIVTLFAPVISSQADKKRLLKCRKHSKYTVSTHM